MILYIFINCHNNQLLKKFEYYPPINLILLAERVVSFIRNRLFLLREKAV